MKTSEVISTLETLHMKRNYLFGVFHLNLEAHKEKLQVPWFQGVSKGLYILNFYIHEILVAST